MIRMSYAGFFLLSISLFLVSAAAVPVSLDALLRDLELRRRGDAPARALAVSVALVAAAAGALLSLSMLSYAAIGGERRATETVEGPYALIDPDLVGAARDARNPYRANLYLEQPDGSVEVEKAHTDDLRIVRDDDAAEPFVEVVRRGRYHKGTFLFISFEGALGALDKTTYRIHLRDPSDIWARGE